MSERLLPGVLFSEDTRMYVALACVFSRLPDQDISWQERGSPGCGEQHPCNDGKDGLCSKTGSDIPDFGRSEFLINPRAVICVLEVCI